MRSKYYKAEKKATTELGDVPNPPFLTNSRVGVSTITTTKAQANVFLSPKESLPERLQFQKRSQCCWRWNDSQLGSKCVNILERELQLKLHIHDRIIQISILSEKAPHLKKIKIGDGCDKQWVCQHEKTEENFLQSLQLLHQISPFSKDKTFLLSKFPPILFATNTLLLLLASMILECGKYSPGIILPFDCCKIASKLMFLCAGKSGRPSGWRRRTSSTRTASWWRVSTPARLEPF